MDVLYIVSTPYHLMVASFILYERKTDEIPHILIEGKSLYPYLKKIEQCVEHLHGTIEVTDEAGNLNKITDFLRLLVRRLIHNKYRNSIKYEKVYVFSPSLKSAQIRQSNPQAEFVLVEEGSGTYSGLILSRKAYIDSCMLNTDLYSRFMKIYFGSTLLYNFTNLMIFRPECVSYNYGLPLTRIVVCKNSVDFYKQMIGYHDTLDSLDKRVVFLGQCYSEIGLSDEVVDEVFELSQLIPNALFKPHPRCKISNLDIEIYESKSWELSSNLMTDSSVLISVSSSGLITPKIIFDIEPYIIFTYKMHPEISQDFYSSFEISYKNAISLYKDRSRVYAPETMEEFKMVIDNLAK